MGVVLRKKNTMNKKLLVLLVCFFVISTLPSVSMAQGTLIHYWHFNNFADSFHTNSIPGIAADFSIHDTSKAKILYTKIPGTSAAYGTYVDSFTAPTADHDTFNARMSAPPGFALRVRNPSDSMELLFYIPTVHYKNILLKYGVERSNTSGMLTQNFDYSVDSGSTWRTTGLTTLSYTVRDTFGLVATSFGSDTEVNNNPKLVFRIKFAGSNTGTSGNNRFDNVTIDGDSIVVGTTPPPNAVQSVAGAAPYILYPNPVINTIELNGPTEGSKQVVISNTSGQKVFEVQETGKHFNLDISKLTPGNYFVRIKEANSNDVSTIQFVKQ